MVRRFQELVFPFAFVLSAAVCVSFGMGGLPLILPRMTLPTTFSLNSASSLADSNDLSDMGNTTAGGAKSRYGTGANLSLDNVTNPFNGSGLPTVPESNVSSLTSTEFSLLPEDVLSNATGNVTSEKDLRYLVHNLKSYVDRLYESPVLSWLKNSYLVSIVVPILMGVCVALSLILLFVLVVSIRRRYRRRRVAFRKKLPKAAENLKQQDQVMLLAASSDEEF